MLVLQADLLRATGGRLLYQSCQSLQIFFRHRQVLVAALWRKEASPALMGVEVLFTRQARGPWSKTARGELRCGKRPGRSLAAPFKARSAVRVRRVRYS